MRQRVEANLRRTDNLDPNDPTYKVVHVTDENTGMKIREFFRARPFTDDFGTRCRRVSRINAPASMPLYAADRARMGLVFVMTLPVQIIFVPVPTSHPTSASIAGSRHSRHRIGTARGR